MKKLFALMTTMVLLLGTGVVNVMADTPAEVSAGAVKHAKSVAEKKQQQVVKEAVDALFLTHKVLDDLDKKDQKSAIKDLEKAIGKLEVVLAAKNAPALLPIDSSVVAVEYAGDLKSIEKSVKQVKRLLDDGRVQEARRLLDTLQSEIDIITVNLPLVSYPQALKLAAKYLHQNKADEARDVLEMALNTLVRNDIVIPLPLLKAEALIAQAKKIAKTHKDQALKHLDAARNELQVAEALGYTSTSDTTYKALDDSIASVEKEIKGKNKAEKLFDELIAKLKEFKEKAIKSLNEKREEK